MFYRLILSNSDAKIILVLIPRVASIFFVIFQVLGMVSYPGGTIHDLSTNGYLFTSNFRLHPL